MEVILNERGNPVPPTEVQKRLKDIHSRLSLRFMEGSLKSHWAITMDWTKKDPRHAKNDRKDRAFDIIGYLPVGCSIDEAPAYLAKTFRTYPRKDVQSLLDRIDKFNASVKEDAVDKATGEVLSKSDPTGGASKSKYLE